MPVLPEREDDEAAGGVVRDDQVLARRVNGEMTRIRTARGLRVDLREPPRPGIDGECGDRAGIAGAVVRLVHGIQELAIRMEGEEAWARRLGNQAHRAQRAGGIVE